MKNVSSDLLQVPQISRMLLEILEKFQRFT